MSCAGSVETDLPSQNHPGVLHVEENFTSNSELREVLSNFGRGNIIIRHPHGMRSHITDVRYNRENDTYTFRKSCDTRYVMEISSEEFLRKVNESIF